MFAKLLKYEWKATGRMLGWFSLAAVAAGALGTMALRFLLNYAIGTKVWEPGQQEQMVNAAAVTGLTMLLFFVVLALVAYFLGTQIVLLYRFYKSKFTDQGYLTFTLPVKTYEILSSSWLNMLLWSVISGLIVAGSILMMGYAVVESIPDYFYQQDALEAAKEMFKNAVTEFGVTYYILSAVSSVADWLIAPLITMTCITVGAVAAKKHKILVAIAIYYGYSMVTGIAVTVLSSVVEILTLASNTNTLLEMSSAITLFVQLLLGVLCWVLTNYLMGKKLNLP